MSNQQTFDISFIPISTYIFPDSIINRAYQAPIDTWSAHPDHFFKNRAAEGTYLVERTDRQYQLTFSDDLLGTLRSGQDAIMTGVLQCVSQQLPAMTTCRFAVTLQQSAALSTIHQFLKLLRDLTGFELSYNGKLLVDFTTPFNFETGWSCKAKPLALANRASS